MGMAGVEAIVVIIEAIWEATNIIVASLLEVRPHTEENGHPVVVIRVGIALRERCVGTHEQEVLALSIHPMAGSLRRDGADALRPPADRRVARNGMLQFMTALSATGDGDVVVISDRNL